MQGGVERTSATLRRRHEDAQTGAAGRGGGKGFSGLF